MDNLEDTIYYVASVPEHLQKQAAKELAEEIRQEIARQIREGFVQFWQNGAPGLAKLPK